MPRFITQTALALVVLSALAAPVAAQQFGKLSGTVVDPAGIPQMGATILVSHGGPLAAQNILQLLTNEKGTFLASRLSPGVYTIKVTLAGFLPTLERNVRVEPNLTTILKIELGSIFSSLDSLRRKSKAQETDADEWAWVLRSAAGTRAILRFGEGSSASGGNAALAEDDVRRPSARVELTAGARRPGSVSNIADAPSTAVAYDQSIGAAGRMTFAGQASFERSAAAGFATTWLPSGQMGLGPETTLVLRQANLGPSRTPFRGVRLEHKNQIALGKLDIDYSGEYLLASVGRSAASLRPSLAMSYQLNPEWSASVILASRPWAHSHGPGSPLQAVLEEMDAFPTILVRDGRPVIEGGWHQEFSAERRLNARATVSAGVFRDGSKHTALFGRGEASEAQFLQDFYTDAFAYDGGHSGSLGSRVSYRQKLSDGTEIVLLYSWAGALTPTENTESLRLRDALETRQRHGLAGRISTRVPKTGTQLSASYKWLSGPALSRQDSFGEVTYQVDPFLNVSVRQQLPSLFATKIEALADFRNLLAQGYVPVDTADGRMVMISAFRSFRGGFSFQF